MASLQVLVFILPLFGNSNSGQLPWTTLQGQAGFLESTIRGGILPCGPRVHEGHPPLKKVLIMEASTVSVPGACSPSG